VQNQGIAKLPFRKEPLLIGCLVPIRRRIQKQRNDSMKMLPPFALLVMLTLGATQNPKSDGGPNIPVTPAVLRGEWINANYLDVVRFTGSPFRAFESEVSKGWFSASYPAGGGDADEITFSTIHEGAPFKFKTNADGSIRFASSDNVMEGLENFDNGSVKRVGADTLMYCTSNDSKDATVFKKVGVSFERYLNKQFIAGEFVAQSAAGGRSAGAIVTFRKDGTIVGMPGYTTYRILIDYNDDVPNCDLIQLRGERNEWFAWSRGEQALKLYGFQDEKGAVHSSSGIHFGLVRGALRFELHQSSR
jgi:hypothetical protein